MANTLQAKKRARQAERHRQRNVAVRSALRTAIKRVLQAVANKDKDAAAKAYREAVSVIDRAKTKGLLHANNAARHKSRLNGHVRGLGGSL